MDWGHTDLFEVIRGEGECAVGDMPMVRDAVPSRQHGRRPELTTAGAATRAVHLDGPFLLVTICRNASNPHNDEHCAWHVTARESLAPTILRYFIASALLLVGSIATGAYASGIPPSLTSPAHANETATTAVLGGTITGSGAFRGRGLRRGLGALV